MRASLPAASAVVLVPGVLTGAQCREVITEMLAGPREPTNVLRAGRDEYAPNARMSESCYPGAAARTLVEQRVAQAARANWPRVDSAGCEISAAHYFRYPATGFVGPHRDRTPNNDDPREVRWRFASLVLFLNDQGGGDNGFDGGALIVYAPRVDGPTVPTVVRPVAGTLALFEPGLVHEVTRVRSGTRFTMVAWLIAQHAALEGKSDAITP